ncbi:hypothetical protein BCV69DRAFT_314608 [Microstroma glucosiphilum]|uniref:Zn(2)-C6 fungal-type domain-containing protein n=1 Tax=Pseudomicrostroma glucosiphilum TaxID=1684307 RepID=A0A316TZ62_9BASI|nr:hypothetical protein BCV69DRAFT_314608 [Pseudomicrostroma glucosiphilum]PWN18407.1 hypothetical protein BCV69DRAFT_314608 [Pseudomicrostroma glucosiphilum]
MNQNDTTPSSHGSPSAGEDGSAPSAARRDQPKKRNRAALSCVACRERKIKCDRQLPCDQCIKRGDEELCFLDPYKRGPPAAQSKSAKVQAQLQEQAKQQAERERQRAEAAVAPDQSRQGQHSQPGHPGYSAQQQPQQARQSMSYMPGQSHHPSYANARFQQTTTAPHYTSAALTSTSSGSRGGTDDMEAIKSRLAQLEAALSSSSRSPGSNFAMSARDADPFFSPHQSHQAPPSSGLPPLVGMLGASSPSSHSLSSWQSHAGDEPARLAPLRSGSNQFGIAADSPSSQASSTRSSAPIYAHPRYLDAAAEQPNQPAPKHQRLSSPQGLASEQRNISQQPLQLRPELDSDTEDAAMVLEGLAMSGKGMRPDEKTACPIAEQDVDPVIKEPQETLTAYVARNKEKDIMLDVSQGGTSGMAADDLAQDLPTGIVQRGQKDNDHIGSLDEVAEMERKGIDVSPAKKVCLSLSTSKSLFRPIFGPESSLGFGMGWAFPAAEAANDLHVKGGQCPGSAQREAVLRAIIRSLPRRALAAQLVSVYADRVNFLAGNIIHIPTFRRDVEAFYALETVEKQARVINNVDAGWLSVFLLVIVLALRFYPCTPPEDWEPVSHLFDGRSVHLYGSAARTALGLARYQSSRSLAVLQAILLSNLSDSHSGRSNPTMLRVAISNAQEMGLNRLGDASRQPKAGESASVVVRREIAKRIWYQLVFKDWSGSCTSHVYSINEKHFNTPLPGNFNDEDLETSPPPAPKDREEFTEMSYTLETYEVIKVLKLRTDLINDVRSSGGEEEAKKAHCPQAAIIDRAFRGVLDGLPSFFSVGSEIGTDTHVEIQRWLLQQGIFHHLLRLHRPALTSKRNARLSCVVLARSVLDTQKKLRSRCTVIDRLIGNLAQSYTAAIVLLMDLLQPLEGEIANEAVRRDVIRSEVAEALRALHHVNETTNSSEGGIKVIEALLAEEQTMWDARQAELGQPGHKRKRAGDRGGPKKKDMLRLAHRIARATQGESMSESGKSEGQSQSSLPGTPKDGDDTFMDFLGGPSAQQETNKDAVSRALMEQLLVPQTAALKNTYSVPNASSGLLDTLNSSGAFDAFWNSAGATGLGTNVDNGEDPDGQFLADHEGGQGFDLDSFLAAYESPGQSSSAGSNMGRDSLRTNSIDDSSAVSVGNGGSSSCDTSVYGNDGNGNDGMSSKHGYFSPPSGNVSVPQHNTDGNQAMNTDASSSMTQAPGQQYGLDAFYNWVLSQALNAKGPAGATPSITQPNTSQHSAPPMTGNPSIGSLQQGSAAFSAPSPMQNLMGALGADKTRLTPLTNSAYSNSGGGGGAQAGNTFIDFLAPFGGPPQNTWSSSDGAPSSLTSDGVKVVNGLDDGANAWPLRAMTPARSEPGQAAGGVGGGMFNLGTPSAALAAGGESGGWLSGPGLFDFES